LKKIHNNELPSVKAAD